MTIRIELIHHYPWLPSTRKLYSKISNIPPLEFVEDLFVKFSPEIIKKRVIKIFKAAFNNKEFISDYIVDELNVYLFIMLKILLYIIDNNRITNRIANLYSKINYKFLKNENDVNLYAICSDLEIDLQYFETPLQYKVNISGNQQELLKTNYRIHFTDYLKLAANLKDDSRKLINNPISKGYIYIKSKSIARLMQEYVRKRIIEGKKKESRALFEADKNSYFEVEGFFELYNEILKQWEVVEENFMESPVFEFHEGQDYSNMHPPCVKEIILKAKEGQNLIHNERLFIVWFLIALNYPVDFIVDIFSTMPDFDRERTMYQVNFAKKKAYTPYQCSTLKSLNLCPAKKYKDKLCLEGYFSRKDDKEKKISHPLQYVNIKQYRILKKQKINENEPE